MNDSSTVLPDSTVDMIAFDIREMTVAHRTHMLAELIPFVAAFLSEVLRAVAAGISQAENDVVEVPVEEEDDAVLMQQPGWIRAGEGCDEAVLMQMQYDPAIPFGSRLAQLQAQLNGMSDGQSAQVAVHLQTMIGRLRRLAGELSRQHRDRFERLEALIATYVDECEGAPLSLQVWGEHQLQALVPYLGGGAGRTPPTRNGTAGRDMNAESGAASSADVVVVENSSGVVAETDVPEYRVRRTPGGEWEPATEQEMAEFRAHDRVLREEALQQARMDEDNYQRMEAANSQRWDDWAIQSEMDSTPRPSRKRIRVLMTVGDAAGRQLGDAQVESTMDAGSQPVVSFQVTETLLGTATDPSIEVGPAAVARHADPKLAPFDPECMPGLSDGLKAFMETKEARYWLQQFVDGMVSEEMIGNRFGTEVLELFQMWLAIQEDMDVQVRNCADAAKHVADTALEDEGEGSNATTVAAGDGHCAGASDRPGYVEPAKEHVAGMDSSSSHDEQGEDETRGEGSSESRQNAGIAEGVASEIGGVESAAAAPSDVVDAGLDHRDGQGRLEGDEMEEDDGNLVAGTPVRCAAVWRTAEAGTSAGVGVSDPAHAPGFMEGSLSDGFGTLPGNEVETEAAVLAPVAAAEMPSTESRASSSTEGTKQTDLKGWLL